jgi:CRP-like cAMP-binding protein
MRSDNEWTRPWPPWGGADVVERAKRTPRRTAFLDHFDGDHIERLLWYLERVGCEAGDVLIGEGEVDRTLFIAVGGTFEVARNGRLVGVLHAGHVFGELAFFDASPRSASVTAREQGEVLRMTRARFDEMWRRDTDLACSLAMEVGRALSERFREEQGRAPGG